MEKLLILIIMLFVSAESLNKLNEIFDRKIFQFLSASFYILFLIAWIFMIIYGIVLMFN